MSDMTRLPALPLIVNDPYFSIWLPADRSTDANTVHWSGDRKWMRGSVVVDGETYRTLGKNGVRAARTTGLRVTPTATEFSLEAGPVALRMRFWSPALPDDLDALSTPITFVDFAVASTDGAKHAVDVRLNVSNQLCYDGNTRPPMREDSYRRDGLGWAYTGKAVQNVLCHSGDRITIDWGDLYMVSAQEVSATPRSLVFSWKTEADAREQSAFLMLGYDDVASINYFGVPCRAWALRGGGTLCDALADFARRHDALLAACRALDEEILERAERIDGEDYRLIVSASWRHAIGAHKLIATPEGELALLSKENDSNGCIGTVDVSYPSAPLFLAYCPELVNALCRPILRFASCPVWTYDFAPHDVGRYPYATGQVYAARKSSPPGAVVPPFYLYPAGSDVYDDRGQMPVEESANMLILLEAAMRYGASAELARAHLPMLRRWADYLEVYGEDPGEQLCTDDFAGHLAHNVNLAAKAVVGVRCFAAMLERFGFTQEAQARRERAEALARSWRARTAGETGTPLCFDGRGWSLKYNLAWDIALGFGLMDKAFYAAETESYLARMNRYGVPLDSRADYTKSDWICWCAAMAQDERTRKALLHPVATYLRESATRVPFSDWYDTLSGDYVEFIARSVQGGVFMPFLTQS